MLRFLAALMVALTLSAQSEWDRSGLHSQVQSFQDILANLLATESIEQKSTTYSTRMRIRIGQDALKPIEPKVTKRTIVSEMGYSLRGSKNPVWAEVRKVLTVDGKAITKPAQARARLLSGLKSDAERERARLLEEFSKYGLEATATDYTLSLLLFRAADRGKMIFENPSSEFVGAERVLAIQFQRRGDDASLTVFTDKEVQRAPLSGILWVRSSDMRPIKLQLDARTKQGSTEILDRAVIEYAPSRFGAVVPQSVIHTRSIDGKPFIESRYTYSNHQRFGADADIKFTTEPEPKP